MVLWSEGCCPSVCQDTMLSDPTQHVDYLDLDTKRLGIFLLGRLIYYFSDAATRVPSNPKRKGEGIDIAYTKPSPTFESSYITSKSIQWKHFFGKMICEMTTANV